MKGIIHCHSANSLYDGSMSVERLCETAKKLGCEGVVLTDHGTLTGTFSFMSAAKKSGIKGIPGVEAYVMDEGDITRKHLVLIPKNYAGYMEICHAVTDANNNMRHGFPCMTKAILEKYFKESENVIATSACVGGVVAGILTNNVMILRDIAKIHRKQAKYPSPSDPEYLENVEKMKQLENEISELTIKRDDLKEIAGKKFVAKEKKLKVLSGEELEKAKSALEKEKMEAEEAGKEADSCVKKIAFIKKHLSEIRQEVRAAESKHEQYNKLQAQLEELEAKKTSEDILYEAALNEAKWYKETFKEFYIELQFHGLDLEITAMPKVLKIAEELNLPLVAANDAHMATNSEEDILQRQLVRSLRFNTWENEGNDFKEYYIKTDEELADALGKILPDEAVEKAIAGIGEIIDKCDVVFPSTLHFPKFHDASISTKERLRKLCEDGIKVRYPDGSWTPDHQKRLDYELEVIDKQGYTDYLCIVQDYITQGRIAGKNNPEGVGMGVGIGRGSAAGSLACYLAGITGVDPIKYDLLFERFLNSERVSSPDIDVDFGKEIRGIVLNYVKSVYGEDAVCNIVTKGSFAGKSAIRAAARLLGDKYDKREEYLAYGDEIARLIPTTPNAKIEDAEEEFEKYKKSEKMMEIIRDAKLIQGCSSNYGTHACGVIIADSKNVSDYVPLMRVKAKGSDEMIWDTQCTCVEAEKNAGLLKFDFLGLQNLDIITETLREIKRRTGKSLDMETISSSLKDGRKSYFDPKNKGNVFDNIFAKGNTTAVFQFESSGMKKMLKQFGPSNIDDIILLVAAYRPGPLQYLEGITDVKRGRKRPRYITPALAPILDKTYGYPIYQEQIMQIFNKVAGFSLGQADEVRRAMGKKHIEILIDPKTDFKGKFIRGLIASGASEADSEKFWNELLDFASYAFNKSHAASYAFVAYYTAWLKLYYPLEYMTAVLNNTPLAKLPMMIAEAKSMGINILPPDINMSNERFTIVNNDIVFGLRNIKGVAGSSVSIIEARKEGLFVDVKDFIKRCPAGKGTVEALIFAGALDTFCKKRQALATAYSNMSDDYKKLKDKMEDVSRYENMFIDAVGEIPTDFDQYIADKKIKNGDVTRYMAAIERMRELEELFDEETIDVDEVESLETKLLREKELLGMFVSGHPLEEYENYEKIRDFPICEAEVTKKGESNTLCGIVEELRISKRKSDDKKIAFFKLSDETGEMDVNCFSAAYAEVGEFLREGAAIEVTGRIEEEAAFATDDDEEAELVKKISVTSIKPLVKKRKTVLVSVNYYDDWCGNVYNDIRNRFSGDTYRLQVLMQMSGEIRTANFGVSGEILLSETNIENVLSVELLS